MKFMNVKKLSMMLVALITMVTSAQATLKSDKVTLKGNMQVEYTKLPSSVDTLNEAFTEGMFYGRLRTNMFIWDWKHDNYPGGILMDDKAMGIGGSFVYKTAPFAGFSATAGLYTSQNPTWFREDSADVGYVKAGKDTFSRADAYDGNFGMTVLAQSYIQYDYSKTTFIYGRQLFESVFTKSNDTKMIPNTFDGATVTIKDIPKTTIKLAYLTGQKLRDHTNSHDVIAFAGGSAPDKWSQNDDAAVNKNLTVDLIGASNELIIGSVTNKSVKNLKANVSYAIVPDVVSNLTLEAHYAIPIGSWKIVPGVRYMQQFDELSSSKHDRTSADTGGVANLLKNHNGYNDKNSLDSYLIATRLDFKKGAFLGRLGYSKIADKADIVAPWRGFPTGGFTRAMAQYNWFANTKTYMARAGYDFGKAGLLEGFSVMGRYAIQDFDDDKPGVFGDSQIIHIDLRQNISKNLEAKFRFGYVIYEDDITGFNDDGSSYTKTDLSYSEYRFELNYFF